MILLILRNLLVVLWLKFVKKMDEEFIFALDFAHILTTVTTASFLKRSNIISHLFAS